MIKILPEDIKKHLNLPEQDFDDFTKKWNEKYYTYQKIVINNELETVNHLNMEDKRVVLLFTYSGAIILLGPEIDGYRWLEYSGIDNKIISDDNIKILNDIEVDKPLYFDGGKLKNSSPIYNIAHC